MRNLTKILSAFSALLLPQASTAHQNDREDVHYPMQRGDNNVPIGEPGGIVNPSNCTHPSKLFQQLVNHPSSSTYTQNAPTRDNASDGTETFLQQYTVIYDFFQQGGPILFYQSPESPLSCLEDFAIYEYPVELGALIVGIEHRFFGLSVPGNLSYADQIEWPLSSLGSLTLKNVMMDSVELLQHVESTVPRAKDSKVFAFGGSYAGTLVALERIHHPEMVFGAFPSSGAFGGLVSDSKDPLIYAMGDYVCVLSFDCCMSSTDAGFPGVSTLRGCFCERLRQDPGFVQRGP